MGQGLTDRCSLQAFGTEIADTKSAVTKANEAATRPRPVIGYAPCAETSQSDREMIAEGLKDALMDLFKGEVPDPVSTVFKLTFTPSEIGTSSEMCPRFGLHKEEVQAAERIEKLYQSIDRAGCGGNFEFRLSVIAAIKTSTR